MNSSDSSPDGPSIRKRLGRLLASLAPVEPESQEELIQILKQARRRHLMDGEALSMMEGVLQVSELQVRDIMIPRARMVVVERDRPLDDILPVITESAHSRFPVIGDDRSEVVGILLAKDLLQFCGSNARRFNMRDILRSAVFVPESKRLNVLLKEFRRSRNHMAIVVDEYGAAAGLITIEDVLEQIVGEIEDEYDFDEGAYILKRGKDRYTAKAHTTIEDFNDFFGTDFEGGDYDTIGGMVISRLGHLPKRGESVEIDGFRFTVVRADSRKIRLLNIEKLPVEAAAGS
ncbi:MAG: magnesium/cobalt efflux protein [Gammaproteobacteria bacterium]|nr:MAG: magnesium/cobalt efflux protein [Gammaproteobacteria bacterium]RTZ73515.1 MAG: magnesium/cobalt efflux protein [Gammaproteobacteria bacterium]RTZ77140.1 MAG: magnesium/cobalt efflux protein [Gammaproteobacteria bacterium]